MAYAAEAKIAEELGRILMDGSLYRGAKPVMWSTVEKTALAEAEIEYEDHTSTTIYARFPVTHAAHASLEGASIIIWTTTPWTMPANRAVAYGDDISYQVTEVLAANDGALCAKGDVVVIADDLADSGHQHVHRGDGFPIVIKTHIKSFDFFRVIIKDDGAIEVFFCKVSFVFGL